MTRFGRAREALSRRRWAVAVTGAVAALVAAGAVVAALDEKVGAGGDGRPAMSSLVGPADEAVAPAPPDGTSVAVEAGREPSPSGGGLPVGEPRIVKTADLSLEVADGSFSDAFAAARSLADAHQGFVVSSSTSGSQASSGSLELRVPAERFEALLDAVSELGEVDQEVVGGQDVSAQIVDLDARLRNLEAEEVTLQALVERAATVGEVLQVRERLSLVRSEIEQLSAQREQLADAAAFSTVRVSLFEPSAGPAPTRRERGLAQDLERALDGAVAVVGGMIVVMGYLAPVALLGGVAWGVLRVRRLRHRPGHGVAAGSQAAS